MDGPRKSQRLGAPAAAGSGGCAAGAERPLLPCVELPSKHGADRTATSCAPSITTTLLLRLRRKPRARRRRAHLRSLTLLSRYLRSDSGRFFQLNCVGGPLRRKHGRQRRARQRRAHLRSLTMLYLRGICWKLQLKWRGHRPIGCPMSHGLRGNRDRQKRQWLMLPLALARSRICWKLQLEWHGIPL